MRIPSVQNIGFLVLGTLSALSHVINAYDISRKLQPQGPLGVTLDYSLARAWPVEQDPSTSNVQRNWVFSSHLEFGNSVSQITDEQLWQIARDAVDEMAVDVGQYQISPRREPNAMTILAWGNEIILASSQRGEPSFSYNYFNSPVLESLRICQIVWRDTGPTGSDQMHRTDGKCAEPMAAHLYYATTTTPLQQQHARIGTWVRQPDGVWLQRDPCGNPARDQWGCDLFVANQNLVVLDVNLHPAPYNLVTLAGGVSVRNQIQLCSVMRPG